MSTTETTSPVLEIRGLSLQGPQRATILDDLSFAVPAGELVALVGESGSGKTMAARAVLRLLPPQVHRSAGSILLAGRHLDVLPEDDIRRLRGRLMGMVFQEPMVSLNPAMRVVDQLCEGMLLHFRISSVEARERAASMLASVGIVGVDACLDSYPHQFSAGTRQRIMLASVMLLRPRLLIADEPTTALDSLTQREVMKVMVELTRNVGTAVLLITHDLGLVSRYATSVVVLQRGRVMEVGRARETLQSPRHPYTRELIAALPRRTDARPPLPPSLPLIEAREISVAFRTGGSLFRPTTTLAVDRVTLGVKPGEVVALVGGSGSGKTTLGRALIGLLSPSGGSVHFRGAPLAHANAERRREFRLACQIVFQDPYSSLDPRQRVGYIVAEPLRHGEPLEAGEKSLRVAAMLEEVGLSGFEARFPHALSGGERQRVAIARALIRRPAFVVADEAVSTLDMTIQKQILMLFKRLQARHGFACLFISHNLAVVSEMADRIAVMHQGRIVEEGSVADIFDRPQHEYTARLIDASAVAILDEVV